MIIIPARGGSKGIPNKNLQDFHGETLIRRAAITASEVCETYVTTDSDDIALEGRIGGAKSIIQPANVSGDIHLSELALEYALSQIEKLPEYFIFMQCTCPLTAPEDIKGAIKAYEENNADTLVTVAESITTPFMWQDHTQSAVNSAMAIGHDRSKRLRRQEIKHQNYIENGAFYIINTAGFLSTKRRFFGKTWMYEMPKYRSLDVDTIEDLELAKAFWEISNERLC